METLNKNNRINKHIGFGIFIIVIGMILLLDNIGLNFPHWIFNWSTLLLAFGLWSGFKKDFKAGGWVVMVIVGGVFTLCDIMTFGLTTLPGALALIGVGLYLVLRPSKHTWIKPKSFETE